EPLPSRDVGALRLQPVAVLLEDLSRRIGAVLLERPMQGDESFRAVLWLRPRREQARSVQRRLGASWQCQDLEPAFPGMHEVVLAGYFAGMLREFGPAILVGVREHDLGELLGARAHEIGTEDLRRTVAIPDKGRSPGGHALDGSEVEGLSAAGARHPPDPTEPVARVRREGLAHHVTLQPRII